MKLTYLDPESFITQVRLPRELISDPDPDDHLLDSIRNIGIKLPVIVDRKYVIIDGVRRLNAVKKLLQEGVELPPVPVLVLEDVDYESCPEEALLRAFLINRYRRGGRDDQFRTDVVADLLLKLALKIAKPVEKQDLARGTIPERVRRELCKLTGLSRTHVHELLQVALAKKRLGAQRQCITVQACTPCRVESAVTHPEDVSILQKHSGKTSGAVHDSGTDAQHCSVTHGRCTTTLRPSSQDGRESESEKVSEIVDAICTAAEKLGLLKKVALGHLPTRVAEEAGRTLDRGVRTVFEYWHRYHDLIVDEARRRYLSDLKVPKSKAELFLKLPEDFVRWLRQLSPWLVKAVVERVDPDIVEQAARLYQHGRDRDALRLLTEAARGRDISRIELPDEVMNTVIELGAYIDLDLVLRAVVELGSAFLRLLLHSARQVTDPGALCESAIRRVLSLSSVRDVQELWHEVRSILDMVRP